MPTFTALTTLIGEDAANALAEAIEKLEPEPTGVGVFEIEDDSGLWEVGAYFSDAPDTAAINALAAQAGAIMAQAGLGCQIRDIASSQYPTPARRPLNSRLDCTALHGAFGIPQPDWHAGLRAVVKELTT